MRLAFLSSSMGWGGLERNLQRYAQWMKTAGHEVEVNAVPDSPLANAVVNGDLPLRLITRQRRYFPVGSARALKNHLLKNRFDFLWIRDPRDLPLAALATSGIACQLIFQQGMQMPHAKKKPWHRMRFAAVDHWICPLKELRAQALQNTPLREDQIQVIPLALDARWFEHPKDKKEARRTWNLPQNVQIVGLFGRLDPLKGQTDLLRAIAEPGAQNWHAFLIGENTPNANGPNQQIVLQHLTEKLGISHRVHWHAPHDDLISAYDCCDVYAMCSDSETFGMVTIEALSRAIPVIGTNTGGTPELLANGAHGKLFATGNYKQLARALEETENWPKPTNDELAKFHRMNVMKEWQDLLMRSRQSPL